MIRKTASKADSRRRAARSIRSLETDRILRTTAPNLIEHLENRRLLSTVTIDTSAAKQTIGGLGANYAEGSFNTVINDSIGQFTFRQLNPNEIRVAIPLNAWEPQPNAQPGNLNSPSFQDTGTVHQAFLLLQQLQSKGATVLGSIWNLPDWIVSNPNQGSQRLIPDANIPALGEAITAFVKRAHDVYGVTINFVSINEGDGGTNTYFSSAQEATLIKTTGADLVSAGLPTKWVAGDTSSTGSTVGYVAPILQDSSTLPYIGAIGYHGWVSSSLTQSDFAAIQTLASQYGLPVWATEVSYEFSNGTAVDSWTNARQVSQNYYKAIAWAGASVVDYWEYQNDFPIESSLGEAYPAFYTLQQMSDALKPGSLIVSATSDDTNILPIAATGPSANQFSLVLQNLNTATATPTTLQGLPNGQYTLMTTNALQDEVVTATFPVTNHTATISLPADSVNTFTNTAAALPTTPFKIAVSGAAQLSPGVGQQYSAIASDQSGTALTTQPTFTWSLDAGSVGTINPATGVYLGPQTGGSAVIRATDSATGFSGALSVFTTPSSSALPAGWSDTDIGSPGTAGLASYDGTTWGIAGSGSDIWGSYDQFNYASTTVNGDVTLAAKITSIADTGSWAKGGIMIRSSTSPAAPYADLVATPGQGLNFQYRTTDGGGAAPGGSVSVSAPVWVELIRSATTNTITAYYSTDTTNNVTAVNWTLLGSANIAMPTSVMAGLAITPNNYYSFGTATFTNVTASSAAPLSLAAPALPTSIAGNGSVSLFWKPVAGATSYNLYRSQSPGGEGSTPYVSGLTGTTFYSDSLATNGITYYYTLEAVNASATSPQSSETFATPDSSLLAPLGGALLGTAGSYNNDGNTIDLAIDRDTRTYFDGPAPDGNWVGLGLSAPYYITSISYAPRPGYESRMVGGVFQASTTADFANPVTLFSVSTTPDDGYTSQAINSSTPYQYVRYLAPDGSYGNVADIQFYGNTVSAAATGTPLITGATTNEDVPSSSGLVLTASDPNTVSYKITGITNGTLFLNDGTTSVTNGQFVTGAQAAAGLKFTPALHQFSTAGTTFSFSAQASTTADAAGLGGNAATASITVNRVAHTPAVTAGTTTAGTQSTTGLVLAANALDTSDAALAYQITGITNGTLFQHDGVTPIANNSFITAAQGAAGLTFTPTSGLTSPSSSFGFTAQASVDGTVAGLGGSTVAAGITVNQAVATGTPLITAAITSEDTQSSSGLVISTSGTNTNYYLITGITNGTLFQADGGTAITNGQYITVDQGTAGLKFTPASHLFSPGTSFSFSAQASSTADATGTGGTAATASITVNRVAHTPTITSATTTASTQSTGGLVITANALDTSDAALAYQVTGISNGALFQHDGVTAIANNSFITAAQGAAGLTFSPTSGLTSPSSAFGFTAQASVDGTVAGLEGSTVAAAVTVNQAVATGTPLITAVTTGEDTQSTSGLVITTSGTNTSYYQITGITNGTLFQHDGVTPITNNSFITVAQGAAGLTFTPAAHLFSPTTSFSFSAQPSSTASTAGLGGTAATASITVNRVAHTPTITAASTTAGTQTTSGLIIAANALDTSDTALAYQITGITNGTLFQHDRVTPITNNSFITAAQGAAGLTFTPTAALTSPGSSFGFTIQASVDGTLAGLGGAAASATVTVNAATVGQLAGNAFGSTNSSWDGVSTIAKAVDGNTNTVFDAPTSDGNWVALNLGSPATITQIKFAPRVGFESRMTGGVFQVATDVNFTNPITIYTIASQPADGLTAVSVSPGAAYQFIRYLSPASSYGNIAEFQVFGTGGGSADAVAPTTPGTITPTPTTTTIALNWVASTDTTGVDHYNVFRNNQLIGTPTTNSFTDTGLTVSTSYSYVVQAVDAAGNTSAAASLTTSTSTTAVTAQITGNVFGNTNSSWDGVSTIAKAIDGNTGTYFDAPTANGNWVALNLGSPATITQIKFAPRVGFESRMTGGVFQVATDVNFTNPITIYTIASQPADGLTAVSLSPGAAYQFIRYLSPASSYGNIAEFQVFGTGGGSADAVAPTTPGTITPTPTTTTIALNWVASTDTTGVDHYNVFRNNQLIGTPTTNSFTDTGLTVSTSYSYVVQAVDAVGNTSSNASLTTSTAAGGVVAQITTGSVLGNTALSWDGVSTIAKAVDGSTSTYFDAPTSDGNWVGLNLGSSKTITQIKFAPRVGFESRMVGGVFQVASDANFTNPLTVYTISSTPPDGLTTVAVNLTGIQFIRYLAPAGSYGNIAELQVFGY